MDVNDNPATPDDMPGVSAYDMRMDPRRAASPAFRRWFADSVVTWEDGSPRVMYHGGSKGNISRFRSDRVGKEIVGWFAFDARFANKYAEVPGGGVYPVVLSLRKVFDPRNEDDQREVGVLYPNANRDWSGYTVIPGPTELTPDERWELLGPDERLEVVRKHNLWYNWMDMEDLAVVRTLKRAGFDGYLDFESGTVHDPTGIAVFDPRDIKSVLNTGTWSRMNGIRNPWT